VAAQALLIIAALVVAIPALAHSWYGLGLVLRPDRQRVQA
jgi:hypothetical protein